MGQPLSKWIRDQAAGDGWTFDVAVELRLSHLLAELRQREVRHRKTRTVASGGSGAEPLRTTDVVPEDLVQALRDERKEAECVYVSYLRKAAKSQPVVENMDVQVGSQHYSMPRITLPCAATLEELEAMNAQYVSYGMLGGRKHLLARQEAALAAFGGLQQDRFIVDGSGYGAMVYVHEAFSDQGRRGKRVLLLLDAEMGIDTGYMKKCFGSAEADGERARHDLKSEEKVGEWGLPKGGKLGEFDGSKMHYANGKGKDTKWRMGSWIARTEAKLRELEKLLAKYNLESHSPMS